MRAIVRYFLQAVAAGLAAAAALAPTVPARALVGPSEDGAAFAPFVVMVLNRDGPRAGFCSGVVVAPRAVLTAAHCVPPGADLRVHFRSEDGAPVLLGVDSVTLHPGYRADAVKTRQRSIDLALLRLPTRLPDRFRAAALAGTHAPAASGQRFRVAGFGVTVEGNGASSGHLRADTLVARQPLSSVLLWANDPSGKGSGACTGDSGGPVFDAAGEAVEALTLWSAGNGSARCGSLTQALWLAPYKGWLEGTLAGWGITP